MTNGFKVTITGADDGVHPSDLTQLSREFPFVEWGILVSPSRFGSQRYPSLAWHIELWEIYRSTPWPVRLSMHQCGGASRNTQAGSVMWLPKRGYMRVQLNGFDPALARRLPDFEGEYILQANAANRPAAEAFVRENVGQNISLLYDCSGGRGISPASGEWPTPPPGVRMGYAGGIGPENVRDVLDALKGREPTWLDMESRVRDDMDRFDLTKVRSVLEAVKRHG